ncbi:MAG: hypothetical protein KJZ57_14610, partial [Anaerolineales bacterium]|nr:hypothetical protein [Anaerolineales bacterium]
AARVDKFAYAEKLAKDKDALRQTLLVWETFWRDALLRASKADSPVLNVDRLDELDAQAARLGLTGTRRRVTEAGRALRQAERNVNARLLLEVLLMDWN